MLDNPFSEEIFPNIQSKPPLAQLEAVSSRPTTCYLGKETDTHSSGDGNSTKINVLGCQMLLLRWTGSRWHQGSQLTDAAVTAVNPTCLAAMWERA